MSDVKVFKFGGASVKDAEAIKNLANILTPYSNHLIIVISAIGKTTNRLEHIINKAVKSEDFTKEFTELKEFHLHISKQLNISFNQCNEQFLLLFNVLEQAHKFDFSFVYDQVVAFGELFSTLIVSEYLNKIGKINTWVDARKCILTDNTYREAKVNMQWTDIFCKKNIKPFIDTELVVTQGFIASDGEGNTTTLGREGSDYTAAILATCLLAKDVTIWKDVDGILNADPKIFKKTEKYDELPYEEVIEMSFYGASVIHPKTLKPLANLSIPLYVKSFLKPSEQGTIIHNCKPATIKPSYILKTNQTLMSISKKDLSFMEEENLDYLFNKLFLHKFKLNLIQKSALSLSIVCNADENKILNLMKVIEDEYYLQYNIGLKLVTIKNYFDIEIPEEIEFKKVVLEQRSRKNVQLLIK